MNRNREWVWWEPGQPVWKKKPVKYNGGTMMHWWDEPFHLMHWSAKICFGLMVSVVVFVIYGIVYLAIDSVRHPDPPRPCAEYSNWAIQDVPARCASYFEMSK